jgi:hypothetical protein
MVRGFDRLYVLAVAGLTALLAPAQAANWLEKGIYMWGPGYDGVLPACDAALDTIASRFAEKEGQFWNSPLTIVGFEKVRETAFRPWAPQTVPRRFCSGIALISDGSKHPVSFYIGEDSGFIGATWGVTWCVSGLDRNWAYNPHCKMARP